MGWLLAEWKRLRPFFSLLDFSGPSSTMTTSRPAAVSSSAVMPAPAPLPTMTTSHCKAFGLGAWAAALHVRYRDTGIVLPFVLQFGLYLSPVIFPSDLVPDPWRLLYSLNPAVGMIEGFRWASFPSQAVHLPALALSLASAFVFLFPAPQSRFGL